MYRRSRRRRRSFPFRSVGTDASAVELARGEVGELVAEDLFEESVFGFFEEGGEADEAALGIAAAEASG